MTDTEAKKDGTEQGGPGPDGQADVPPRHDGSIRASIAELIAAGRELVDAELTWAKLKAANVATIIGRGIVLAVSALVLLMMGVMILIVAAVIALAPLVGLLVACLIVAGVAMILAGLLALAARSTFATLFEAERR